MKRKQREKLHNFLAEELVHPTLTGAPEVVAETDLEAWFKQRQGEDEDDHPGFYVCGVENIAPFMETWEETCSECQQPCYRTLNPLPQGPVVICSACMVLQMAGRSPEELQHQKTCITPEAQQIRKFLKQQRAE